MAASAPVVPDGGARTSLLRRLATAMTDRIRRGDLVRWTGLIGAIIPVLMLLFVFGVLLSEAWPAIAFNGWNFLSGRGWSFGSQYGAPISTGGVSHQPGETFGALPQVIGTLETSAIALIVAIPVAVGAALVIVERLPPPGGQRGGRLP